MADQRTLTIGKYRGLQRCATPNGALVIVALDHRNNLRKAMAPQAPSSISDEALSQFKQLVTKHLAPVAPAVLLDPEFGAAQVIAGGVLPRQAGLVVAAEATGYTGEPTARESQILPGWSIAKARRIGADAIKLLVYYHPEAPTAPEIETFVAQVAADCRAEDIALFLEPLSYSNDPARPKLPPAELRRVVIETARRLTPLGVDVLKAEFPHALSDAPDEAAWAAACAELTAASQVPWILLSASVSFETYLRQVVVACEQGASGVAVGRAVWQEAVLAEPAERVGFLAGTAAARLARLAGVCDALARPWTDWYSPQATGSGWYHTYLA